MVVDSIEHIEVVLLVENKRDLCRRKTVSFHDMVFYERTPPEAENPNDLFALFHPLFEAYKYSP